MKNFVEWLAGLNCLLHKNCQLSWQGDMEICFKMDNRADAERLREVVLTDMQRTSCYPGLENGNVRLMGHRVSVVVKEHTIVKEVKVL